VDLQVYRAGLSVNSFSPTDVHFRCQGQHCRDPGYYKQIMREHYPVIEVYDCDERWGT
jgi:hypothetical protein